MKFEKVMKKIEKIQKGSFHSMVWERQCKTKKAFSDNIVTKRSYGTVRLGIDYDNMKAVQEKRANGELPEKNAGLTWGEWEVFPYIIKHKESMYLRVATSGNKTNTEYFLNGKKVSYEDVEIMLLASEKKNSSDNDVFTINCENIISL